MKLSDFNKTLFKTLEEAKYMASKVAESPELVCDITPTEMLNLHTNLQSLSTLHTWLCATYRAVSDEAAKREAKKERYFVGEAGLTLMTAAHHNRLSNPWHDIEVAWRVADERTKRNAEVSVKHRSVSKRQFTVYRYDFDQQTFVEAIRPKESK